MTACASGTSLAAHLTASEAFRALVLRSAWGGRRRTRSFCRVSVTTEAGETESAAPGPDPRARWGEGQRPAIMLEIDAGRFRTDAYPPPMLLVPP